MFKSQLKSQSLRSYLIFLLCLSPLELQEATAPRFVLWNVGQGQWSTFILPALCLHIDTGGEHFPWKKILQACKARRNLVLFTHFDHDHINAAQKFAFSKLNACGFQSLPPRRKFYLRHCELPPDIISYQPSCTRKKCSRNDLSLIIGHRGILISGDSPQWQERHWIAHYKNFLPRAWVLGHHGSRTSNAFESFQTLRPKMALVSARFFKYGHPHAQTVFSTRRVRVPLLKTEDWGNIILELEKR